MIFKSILRYYKTFKSSIELATKADYTENIYLLDVLDYLKTLNILVIYSAYSKN